MSLALERLELALWQRVEEGVRHFELAAVGSETALDRMSRKGGQACNRGLAANDHDLLACRGTPDQARQVRLGGVYGDGCHIRHIRLSHMT